MTRRLWGVVAGGVAVVAAAVVSICPKCTPPSPPPPRVHFSDLPRVVYRTGEHRGRQVRVAFYRRPEPTSDPLVWHFHPGEPAAVVPPSYRLHFAAPPVFGPLPVVVVGTVEGVEADLTIRPSGVPGLLVLRDCTAVPQDSP